MVCYGLQPNALGDHSFLVKGMVLRVDDPRRYVQVAASIRARIESGEIRPGQPVPSINQIVQEHGVARQTAAKALHLLESEGIVKQWPGLGFFAQNQEPES